MKQRILVGARAGRELEARLAELLDRRGPAGGARPGDERRREDDAVHEHRDEEALDVLGDDVAAAVQERPGAGDALDREAAADGAADRDDVEVTRRADEIDDPVVQDVVDVDVLGRVAEDADVVER